MERVLGLGGIFFKCKDPAALKAWYRDHLGALGFESLNQRTIATQRVRHGANAAARADGEALLVVRKPAVAR